MSSMKKVILLTCLAGTVGSMNAGIWQNVKDSCSGFYAACAKSVNENTTALSTSACKMYASCIDTLRTNKDAAVTGIGAMGTKIATTASNTRETISNGVTSAGQTVVKVTAPIVNPVVSATQSIADGLASTAQFSYEHPKLVGSVALAATIAYVAHCRNATQHWLPDLKEVQSTLNSINPNNNFKDWRVKGQANKPAWSMADMMSNPQRTYAALKIERGNSESDNAFILRMLGNRSNKGELQLEQDILQAQADKIKSVCLAYSHMLPSIRSHEYHKNNNFVTKLIQERINAMPYSERYIDLSAEQMQYINQQVNKKVAPSYINPFKMARRWALPHEASAIKQYWELYQSIQRIEALKACVQAERERLNLQRDPRAAQQLAVVVEDRVGNLQ